MRGTLGSAALLISAIILVSCGPSKPEAGDGQFLDEIGFNGPITLAVILNNGFIYQAGTPPNDNNSALIAALTKAGVLKEIPVTDHPPWWAFYITVMGWNTNGFNATIPVGRRVIAQHSNEESWSEGSVDYYAETITYSIDVDALVKSLIPYALPLESLRLVVYRDPAVAKWVLFNDPNRGTHYNQDDSTIIARALIGEGQKYLGDLPQAVIAAQQEAFAKIQENLAASGAIEIGATPQTLLSKRNGVLIHLGDPISLSRGVSIATLQSYCSALGSASWHMATPEELNALVQLGNVDTPDHRLWGDMTDAVIVTTSGQAFSMQVNSVQLQQGMQGGKMLQFNGLRDIATPLTDGWGNSASVRAVCISQYPG